MTPFRRAYITEETRRVAVEVVPGAIYVLPGTYDPRPVLERVIAARVVNLELWEKAR